jgi:hypothetical protein
MPFQSVPIEGLVAGNKYLVIVKNHLFSRDMEEFVVRYSQKTIQGHYEFFDANHNALYLKLVPKNSGTAHWSITLYKMVHSTQWEQRTLDLILKDRVDEAIVSDYLKPTMQPMLHRYYGTYSIY